MNTLKPTTKRNSADFIKALAASKTKQNKYGQKQKPGHQNVSPYIKDMWEVYLGFSKLEF